MSVGKFIWDFVLLGFVAAAGGVLLWRWLQHSRDEPLVLLLKLAVTGPLLALPFWLFLRMGQNGSGSYALAFTVALTAAAVGIVGSILWAPNLAEFLVNPITSAFDGGDEQVEPQAFYSVAKALSAKGKVADAIAEIELQLEKFPGDHEGLLLLAEMQAKLLHDLSAAEATIQRLCVSPGKTPAQIASALTAMADWHMKVGHDLAAAHGCLVQIREQFPDTEFDAVAAQRLAHLGDGTMLLGSARRAFAVPEGVKNYGLNGDRAGVIKAEEISPEAQTTALITQLEVHPLDTEAREKLAELYAGHYQRFDLALLQLEDLIAQPNQPARSVVRWLNRIADWHVIGDQNFDLAKASLQRIGEKFPGAAAADVAQNRIERLRLEFKGKEKNQAVKLGSYEQNIGLKYGPPKRH
ncbi:MAG: hypothetical protein RL380_428 [Verrucomicrobiota bacterium]|jgi:hypothetical protein